MNDLSQYESAISTLIGTYVIIAILTFIIPIIFFITLWLNVRSIKKDMKKIIILLGGDPSNNKKDAPGYYRVKY